MGEQTCEVCGKYLPVDPFEDCVCRERQDAVWYANGGQAEPVADVAGTRLAIHRVGYTRFIYFPDTNKDERYELCNTSDFEGLDIQDDTELLRLWNINALEIDDSPWFEIYDKQSWEYREQDATFTTLDEAYQFALRLPDNERKWAE